MVLQNSQKRGNRRPLEWLNFFLADVQTGLGPFLAAYLAASGWNPDKVGYALMFGSLVTVALQTPAGAVVDAIHSKRALLAVSLGVLVSGALLLMTNHTSSSVYIAQLLIGGAAPFLAPTVAAITMGIVGVQAFDRQFGRNQAFNSAGNVFAAGLIAVSSYFFGNRAIFLTAAVMAVPAVCSILSIDSTKIDYARSRGGKNGSTSTRRGIADMLRDRALIVFLVAVFLFHLANAAMLPELGEMLSKNNKKMAAPFMSACIIVTQVVIAASAAWIGRRAAERGRKPLLLFGFGVLPIRGVLYTLTHVTGALIAIQTLDGVANSIFAVVSLLVIADRTRGTGHFNLAAGSLATVVGIGAALSNAVGGYIIQQAGYTASFIGLAAIACVAFAVLALGVPETKNLHGPQTDRRERNFASGIFAEQ